MDGSRWLRHQDVERELDGLLRRARRTAGAHGNGVGPPPRDADRSVLRDLSRIEDFVRGGFDRSITKSLAFFSCAAHGLWEVFALPVPVLSRVVINDLPAVGVLEAVLHEYERVGILLVDRHRSRILVFDLDGLAEERELVADTARGVDTRGEKERGDVQHHVDAMASQHIRHAADAAWQVFQEVRYEHLAIGGPDDVAGILEAALHPYLRQRLAGRVGIGVAATIDEVAAAAREVEARVERTREVEAVRRLRDAVGTARRGVAGLAPVLDALAARRVEHLLVSRGYAVEGWRCGACSRLAAIGRACPACRASMDRVDDVVEEAVEDALAQSCRVDICTDAADLDVLGRIGALLRY